MQIFLTKSYNIRKLLNCGKDFVVLNLQNCKRSFNFVA